MTEPLKIEIELDTAPLEAMKRQAQDHQREIVDSVQRATQAIQQLYDRMAQQVVEANRRAADAVEQQAARVRRSMADRADAQTAGAINQWFGQKLRAEHQGAFMSATGGMGDDAFVPAQKMRQFLFEANMRHADAQRRVQQQAMASFVKTPVSVLSGGEVDDDRMAAMGMRDFVGVGRMADSLRAAQSRHIDAQMRNSAQAQAQAARISAGVSARFPASDYGPGRGDADRTRFMNMTGGVGDRAFVSLGSVAGSAMDLRSKDIDDQIRGVGTLKGAWNSLKEGISSSAAQMVTMNAALQAGVALIRAYGQAWTDAAKFAEGAAGANLGLRDQARQVAMLSNLTSDQAMLSVSNLMVRGRATQAESIKAAEAFGSVGQVSFGPGKRFSTLAGQQVLEGAIQLATAAKIDPGVVAEFAGRMPMGIKGKTGPTDMLDRLFMVQQLLEPGGGKSTDLMEQMNRISFGLKTGRYTDEGQAAAMVRVMSYNNPNRGTVQTMLEAGHRSFTNTLRFGGKFRNMPWAQALGAAGVEQDMTDPQMAGQILRFMEEKMATGKFKSVTELMRSHGLSEDMELRYFDQLYAQRDMYHEMFDDKGQLRPRQRELAMRRDVGGRAGWIAQQQWNDPALRNRFADAKVSEAILARGEKYRELTNAQKLMYSNMVANDQIETTEANFVEQNPLFDARKVRMNYAIRETLIDALAKKGLSAFGRQGEDAIREDNAAFRSVSLQDFSQAGPMFNKAIATARSKGADIDTDSLLSSPDTLKKALESRQAMEDEQKAAVKENTAAIKDLAKALREARAASANPESGMSQLLQRDFGFSNFWANVLGYLPTTDATRGLMGGITGMVR